jgi:hypothetical protein
LARISIKHPAQILPTKRTLQPQELKIKQNGEEGEKEKGKVKFKSYKNLDSDLREHDCFISKIY